MSEYTNFNNVVERLKPAELTDFQSRLINIYLTALSQNLSHQLYMVAVESQDLAVLEAVKTIAQAMSVELDVDRLTLLVKGN